MTRRSHLLGAASLGALGSILASAAIAQQSLPTISVGAARGPSRPGPAARPAPGPARVTTASPAPAAAPGFAPGVDRYTEPKPAPFSRTLPANIPAVVESRTRMQIMKTTNIVTSADAFKYLPSVFVRERFPGDRNAIVSGRTTGTIQGAMTLVYADNVLLSNLLGNSFNNAPRWGMVSPAEISRIDVIYGPFSALYPGNSIGGVLTMTTRMPDNFEVHASGTGFLQPFSLYGRKELNPGGVMNVLVGNRHEDLRYWVGYEYFDNQGQMQFFRGNNYVPGAGTPFFGGFFGYNQEGRPRIITGGDSADHVQQHLAKFKVSYDITPDIRAKYQVGFWNLSSGTSAQTFVNDRNGVPIYNTINGRLGIGPFAFSPGAINPGRGGADHLMQAIEVRRDTGGVFDFGLSATSYNFLRDFQNNAQSFGLRPNVDSTVYNIDPRGLNTNQGGTYWRTVDARFILRPQEPLLRSHEISFGAHGDQYGLNTVQTSTVSWPSNQPLSLQQVNLGKTQTVGTYIQDAWKFMPDWKATVGMRAEHWRALDGSNVSGGVGVNNATPRIVTITPAASAGAMFPDSSKSAFSPKGALEWKATPELTFRGSIARAYRFPTVTELFQSLTGPNNVTINNPNLQPEICTCYDFTTDYRWVDAFNGAIGLFNPRVSLFLDERWNAIVNQNLLNAAGRFVSTTTNIDRARFRGVELALLARDAFTPGLDVEGGVTFTDSKIISNLSSAATGGFLPNLSGVPGGSIGDTVPPVLYAGRQFPRIPRIRIRGVVSYSPTPDMSFAVGLRYSSASFITLANSDFNHNDFNNSDSELLFVDLKARYRVAPNWWLSAGVNNVGRYKAYVNPNPYPQRMFFLALNYDIGGPDDAPAAGLGGAGGPGSAPSAGQGGGAVGPASFR